MNKWMISLLLIILASGCFFNQEESWVKRPDADMELWEKASTYFTPLDKTAWLKKQNLSEAKIALGRDLFLDKNLSINGTKSCNSCHDLNNFGVDNKVLSEGHNGQKGKRNTPSVYNAVLHFAHFWDAGAKNLKEQAILPILKHDEMGMPSEEALLSRLAKDTAYVQQFEQLYGKQQPGLSVDHIADALAEFESTLVTSSRFDDYLLGDYNALNNLEKEGLNKFLDLGCSPCHSGQGIGGQMMHRFALQGYYWDVTKSKNHDEGRYAITGNELDKYVFKVPSLRNVAETFPYFHDGSVEKLEDAVRIMAKLQLNYNIQEEEIHAIVAFLNALTASHVE